MKGSLLFSGGYQGYMNSETFGLHFRFAEMSGIFTYPDRNFK